MCVLDFGVVLSDQSEFMALLMVFKLWIGPGCIFQSCLFLIFNSHFTGTALGLDLSLCACLNKFPLSMVSSDKTAQSKRPFRLGASFVSY